LKLVNTGFKFVRVLFLQICLLVLLPALVLADDFQTPALTPQQLLDLQKQAPQPVVVDVRNFNEYKSGHIPGAINIPHNKIARQLEKLEGAEHVVLYCSNGRRTRQAEQVLLDNMVDNVFHLQDGLMGWRQQRLRLTTGWAP
jgi:rhodanese-related sulfurtransferase